VDLKKVGRVGKMYDAIKVQGEHTVDKLKSEFTKTPEQLTEKQLGQATWLANAFTSLRRVVYFIMPVFGIIAAIVFANRTYNSSPYIFSTILWILFVIYLIFKSRDLIRGKI
jgi:hypothetical protein